MLSWSGDGALAERRRYDLQHGERGLDGSVGIVLVRDRGAEDGNDRVTDELLHPPLAPLDLLGQLRERLGHQRAELLGIEVLREGGEAHEVGKENRDDATLTRAGQRRGRRDLWRGDFELRPAGGAEGRIS